MYMCQDTACTHTHIRIEAGVANVYVSRHSSHTHTYRHKYSSRRGKCICVKGTARIHTHTYTHTNRNMRGKCICVKIQLAHTHTYTHTNRSKCICVKTQLSCTHTHTHIKYRRRRGKCQETARKHTYSHTYE